MSIINELKNNQKKYCNSENIKNIDLSNFVEENEIIHIKDFCVCGEIDILLMVIIYDKIIKYYKIECDYWNSTVRVYEV